MLEYSKVILVKVSFDKWLFEKEFRKLKSWLAKAEQLELIQWLKHKFETVYPELVSELTKE